MTALPHFPFYPRDFFSDHRVQLMTNAEVGAYLRLLAHSWSAGGIPDVGTDALTTVARIMQEPPEVAAEMWKTIAPCWKPGSNGMLVNTRQEEERAKALSAYKQRMDANAASVEARRLAKETAARTDARTPAPTDVTTYGGPNSELITQTLTSVPKGTAPDDVENWNDVLAPLVREAGGEAQVGNWLKWCKRQLTNGVSLETLEDWIGGMVELRDTGRLAYIPKEQTFKPAAIERLPIGERDQLRKAVR